MYQLGLGPSIGLMGPRLGQFQIQLRGVGRIFRQNFVWFCKPVARQLLKCISKQNLIKLYFVVQELLAFSVTDHDRPDWCSAKPRHRFAYQCQGNVKMYKFMCAKVDQNMPIKQFIGLCVYYDLSKC